MSKTIAGVADTTDREVVLTRILKAPRELVFRVWTDPEHVPQWWGPKGFTTTTYKMDVSPGGVWRYCMHGPDGRDYQNRVTFIEIVPPERIVFKHGGGDDDCELVGHETTVTFEKYGDDADRTKVTMRMVFESPEAMEHVVKTYGAIEGGKQHLERLAAHVEKMPAQEESSADVAIKRVFDAPRERVFKAWTDPEQLKRWYAPHGCSVVIRTMDIRPGGAFHHCIRTPGGHECWCKGVYREIVAPERIVYTLSNSDEKGRAVEPRDAGMDPDWPRETTVTVTFAERQGRTLLTLRQSVLESLAKRTGAHPSWIEMLSKLEEQLAKP